MSPRRLAVSTSILLVGAAMSAYSLRRDVLWLAVKTCSFMSEFIGTFYPPCFRVESKRDGMGGQVIFRPTASPTHFVIAPFEKATGIEDELLLGATGSDIWTGAWNARRHVLETTIGVGLNAIGVAANSKGSRSQDQLHIHIDCIKPGVLARVVQFANLPRGIWSDSNVKLERNPLFVLPVAPSAVTSLNPFIEIQKLPAYMHGASIAGLPDGHGGLLLFALRDPMRGSEELLDHSCALSSRGDEHRQD